MTAPARVDSSHAPSHERPEMGVYEAIYCRACTRLLDSCRTRGNRCWRGCVHGNREGEGQ